MFGFPKRERDNLNAAELKTFKEAGKYVLALTEKQMITLLRSGDFVEVKRK